MGNSASSLPYSIGKQIAFVNNGWELHEGNRKSDGEAVSVFMAKKPALMKTPVNTRQPNLTQYQCAYHHFTNCKKLRHPHILQVLATLDTDNPNDTAATGIGNPSNATAAASSKSNTGDLIIVTEPCITLEAWIRSNPPPEQIAWGLESIVRGLHFLHASANMCHGNISPESFYVTPAGDVKIWNFSLVSSISSQPGGVPRHFIDWEGLITPNEYRAPERIEGRWDAIGAAGIHCMDSYSLGIFINYLFNNNIPTKLVKAVQRLQTTNIKMRPRLQPLLKCPVFDTPYQKLQLQLEEFAVQPVEQKIAFFQNMTPNLQAGIIPEQLAVYRLLPLIKSEVEKICTNETLRTQDMYRRQVMAMLNPLFYIAETYLDSDKVGSQLGNVSGILFKVNDRGIRGTLLQKASFMAQSFDKNALNEAVFEPLCSGFSDSSGALRELTLKAAADLVPHLTQPNLEKLSRYLVRLQSDQETSIRTNTVIFFSKLAPYLTEVTRQKMLLPAFIRAMKDPFTPCRLSALRSTLKAKEFFDPEGIASRVLPAVTPQLLDPSAEVRREAFSAVEDLLFILRQESERLSKLPDPNNAAQPVAAAPSSGPIKAATNTSGVAEAPKSGGFSFGGSLTSWISSSKTPDQAPQSAPPAPPPARLPAPAAPVVAPVRPVAPVIPTPAMNNMNLNSNGGDDSGWNDDSEGWGDDDLDVSGPGNKTAVTSGFSAPPASAPAPASNLFAAPAASEDDFFGSFDAKPARPVAMKKPGTTGKLLIPSKKTTTKTTKAPKPAVTKLAASDDQISDGWDDF